MSLSAAVHVRIGSGRCGPVGSGNGGWTAGLVAGALGASGPLTVTLRRPPPLETDLRVEPGPPARLLHGDDVVAEAAPTEDHLPDVAPVEPGRARAAERAYAGLSAHPFPRCFVCGPDRGPGDGLGLRPGPVGTGRTACTWVPDAAFAGPDGTLDPAYAWAALDCPGGWTANLAGRPLVLGRITGRVARRPLAGETLVVVGQHRDTEGRKTRTATTLYDESGTVVGRATQLWIAVDPAAFAIPR